MKREKRVLVGTLYKVRVLDSPNIVNISVKIEEHYIQAPASVGCVVLVLVGRALISDARSRHWAEYTRDLATL